MRKDSVNTRPSPASGITVKITRAESPIGRRHTEHPAVPTRPRSTGDRGRTKTSFTTNLTEYCVASRDDRGASHEPFGTVSKENHLQIPSPTSRRRSAETPKQLGDDVLQTLSDVTLRIESSGAVSRPRSRSPSPFDFIEREALPSGSTTFQRVLYELQSESDMSRGESDDTDNDMSTADKNSKLEKKAIRTSKPRKKSTRKSSSGTTIAKLHTRTSKRQ